jgi:hypothetical protein
MDVEKKRGGKLTHGGCKEELCSKYYIAMILLSAFFSVEKPNSAPSLAPEKKGKLFMRLKTTSKP